MNSIDDFSPLVTASWLREHLDEVVVLDGSYYLASMGKDADQAFKQRHIAGAMRWNIDAIAEPHASLKHMMPAADVVAQAAADRGISNQSTVVIYDQLGMFSAARVWLTLKLIGHQRVALLDGGLPAWDGPVESGEAKLPESVEYGDYQSTDVTVDRDAVAQALSAKSACVVDARAAGRFSGTAAEPVQGLRSGHMPGAINLPFTDLLTSDNRFKPVSELKQLFAEARVDLSAPIITSCGSGVTASVISFALYLLETSSLVYDGSWSEWGQPELNMPVTCDV